jgi:hypothetical protein
MLRREKRWWNITSGDAALRAAHSVANPVLIKQL